MAAYHAGVQEVLANGVHDALAVFLQQVIHFQELAPGDVLHEVAALPAEEGVQLFVAGEHQGDLLQIVAVVQDHLIGDLGVGLFQKDLVDLVKNGIHIRGHGGVDVKADGEFRRVAGLGSRRGAAAGCSGLAGRAAGAGVQ